MKIKNKKAQVGETITWSVATIIILVLLFLFIMSVGLMASSKKPFLGLGRVALDEGSKISNNERLLAILNKKVGGKELFVLIEEAREKELNRGIKDYSVIEKEVKKILDEAEQKGIKCSFGLVPSGIGGVYRVVDSRSSLDVARADFIKIRDLEARLICD